jgi:hypothetical protein
MFVAISIWTIIKACCLKPKLNGCFYLTMMWFFIILDVVDHGTDFINAFFLPHHNLATSLGITIGFLTPVFLMLHELVESDSCCDTISAYFGYFEEAEEDSSDAEEL